jgi:hypothetical protein
VSLRVPLALFVGVALTIPVLACNALKKSNPADAGEPAASASAGAASASAADAGLAPIVDAAPPPRYVAPTPVVPKPDPDVCKQARALRASGNPAWQRLAPQCVAQGGKI